MIFANLGIGIFSAQRVPNVRRKSWRVRGGIFSFLHARWRASRIA